MNENKREYDPKYQLLNSSEFSGTEFITSGSGSMDMDINDKVLERDMKQLLNSSTMYNAFHADQGASIGSDRDDRVHPTPEMLM